MENVIPKGVIPSKNVSQGPIIPSKNVIQIVIIRQENVILSINLSVFPNSPLYTFIGTLKKCHIHFLQQAFPHKTNDNCI
ncbi:MAG: hypothetical protein IKZ84_17320, partial [Victivallales bacterium]|nr:hypothetical protein [Victivallales bacterium]